MLHSTFEVGGHHGQRLSARHLPPRVVVRHVDRSAGIVRVDHTAARLLVLCLLLDSTGAVGRLVVAGWAALCTTLVVMCAVVMMADHAGTVHDGVLVAYFLDGRKLLHKKKRVSLTATFVKVGRWLLTLSWSSSSLERVFEVRCSPLITSLSSGNFFVGSTFFLSIFRC